MVERNIIHNQDFLKGLKGWPRRSVDMILSDLPYGITSHEWDVPVDLEKMWFHFRRVIKDDGAIVLFAASPFDKELAMSQPPLYRYDWIWEKSRATNHLNSASMPMRAHENILVFYKRRPTYNPQLEPRSQRYKSYVGEDGRRVYKGLSKHIHPVGVNPSPKTHRLPRTVLRFASVGQTDSYHPSEKPIALCEYLIKTYTNPGQLVLDVCCGAGSVPLAAKRSGRDYIGYEIDPYFSYIARKRLEEV